MRSIYPVEKYFEYTEHVPNYKVNAKYEKNKSVNVSVSDKGKHPANKAIYILKLISQRKPELFCKLRTTATTKFSIPIVDRHDGEYNFEVYIVTSDDIITEDHVKALITASPYDFPYNDAAKTMKSIDKVTSGKFKLGPEREVTRVRMERAGLENTIDQEFWEAIKRKQLHFRPYLDFINRVLYEPASGYGTDPNNPNRVIDKRRGAFLGMNEYQMLKYGTEFYMLKHSALDAGEVVNYMPDRLPYFEHLSDTYESAEDEYPDNAEADEVRQNRFKTPFFIELIWNYWMEQGMLMQAMNLINLRFQNISVGNGSGNQLSRFDLSPLRPLSHLLWGFIQDEQHRLSLARRTREYDHEYGLVLSGRSTPAFAPADSRSKFLEAFHNLLTTASIYFKESDDTTRIADAFPVLNSLKEVHLLLAEGNHNAYGNLTWTARHEMLMTQYLIARDETRVFLGGRPMVPYPEEWMDRIDTIRNMMGWGSTSITYFYDLAIHGEKLLLSIRYGDWSDANMPAVNAANWALAFRDSVQKYMHGLRTVAGVDLTADAAEINSSIRNIQPAILIQRRVLEERSRMQRRA